MMNKQPQPIFASIQSLSHEGRGITEIKGKTTFVEGALPGETILCEITHTHRRYNEARTVEVLTASANRIEPACLHFNTCGGCSLQHMDMATQIQFKQNALLEQLKLFGNVSPQKILPPIQSTAWNYRRRARLGIRYEKKRDEIIVGFRGKFSHQLTVISMCHVLDKRVHEALSHLGKMIRTLSQFKYISQVEIATSDTEVAFVLRHLKPLLPPDLDILSDFAKSYHLEIYLQPNSPLPIHKVWPPTPKTELTYSLKQYELDLQFHPLDFVQVNAEANQALIKCAIELLNLNKEDEVLDLFCGLGNFTLPIAKYTKKVTGIEGNDDMVKRARQNAQFNHLQNTDFFLANLFNPVSSSTWIRKYNKILIDPPRAGAKEIIQYCSQFSAEKIVYVSCNPATLARDAKDLVYNFKYKLTCAGLINMFPHTTHMEAIAVFEK